MDDPREFVLQTCKDQDIKFIRFWFTDILGSLKSFAITVEELEQAIQDSGDSMEEFVGVGMNEAGLDWDEPPVEHYRDGGTHFYFATPIDLEHITDLDTDKLRNQVLRMLEGYLIAFGPVISGAEE